MPTFSLVAKLTEATKDSRNAPAVADSCVQVLYQAAIIFRSEMKGVTEIEHSRFWHRVTGMEGTRDRWALTAHMMAAATASFKVMSGTSASSSCHRELGSQRIERDENDVSNIIRCIETKW